MNHTDLLLVSLVVVDTSSFGSSRSGRKPLRWSHNNREPASKEKKKRIAERGGSRKQICKDT